MDALDKRLIDLLADDAWRSADALARRLNTSASTVRRKIKRLLESGTIRIVALSDSAKVGLPVTAIMVFDVTAEKLDSAMQALQDRPEVRWAATTIGRFDIVALLRLSSTEDLFTFVQRELPKIEGIRNSETFICVHTTSRGGYIHL